MDDLISRQAAEEALLSWNISFIVLNPVPSADVRENVNGEWEEIAESGLCDLRRCSNCGHIEAVGLEIITPKPNYCPNCGAQMMGGES